MPRMLLRLASCVDAWGAFGWSFERRRMQAVGAPKGLIGPNLSNIGSRAYIAAGWLRNTDENLERWIREPQAVKKGVLMPNLGVTVEEARALRAYLRAHQ